MKAKKLFSALALLGVVVLISACSNGMAGTEESFDELKSASTQPDCCIASGTIAEAEAAGLLFMYEEEKMARDVYNYLSPLYKLPVFRNIAKSEQAHMDAVKNLIVGFGIVEGDIFKNGPGVYSSSELQSLYTGLTDKGKLSLTDALEVGVLVEETDIEDLEAQLATLTNKSIITVYTNLLAASKVHLSAFQSKL